MDDAIMNAVFKPKSSKQEAKADTTTRVAREIMDGEAAARIAKSERLRLARLAMPPAEKPAPKAKAAPKARKTVRKG